MRTRWRVVVVGSGPAALRAALTLDRSTFSRDDVDVTLVSERRDHDVVPLLPDVLLGRRPAGRATIPVERSFAVRRIALALGGEPSVDPASSVVTVGSNSYPYDALIVCPAATQPGGEWAGAVLPSSADAVAGLRSALLERCRRAAWSMDERERRRLLTAVVVGAGWSGVVWAGALAATLRRMAAALRLPRESTTVYLVEADERVLPRYTRPVSANAGELLGRARVSVRLQARAVAADTESVRLSDGEILDAATVVYCAGWPGTAGPALPPASLDGGGRIAVNRRMRTALPGYVFACGGAAAVLDGGVNSPPAPWEADVRQADVAAANAMAAMAGGSEISLPDLPADIVAPIGDWALATVGPIVLAGPLASVRAALEPARYLEAVGGAAAVLSSL